MQLYSIEGFYSYNGLQGKLTGEIEIDNKGIFESTITDHMSRIPEQMIKGIIITDAALTKLSFFKYPMKANLANLIYQLEKPKTTDFSGKYTGKWSALPYKIEFDESLGLMLARIDTSVAGCSDYAQLELYRKI